MKCPYCGSLEVVQNMDGTYKCEDCGQLIKQDLKGQTSAIASSLLSSTINTVNNVANNGAKSRIIAAALAICLGIIGAQYFYLGKKVQAIACIAISCTIYGLLLTATWGIISAILFLSSSNDEFNDKYTAKK